MSVSIHDFRRAQVRKQVPADARVREAKAKRSRAEVTPGGGCPASSMDQQLGSCSKARQEERSERVSKNRKRREKEDRTRKLDKASRGHHGRNSEVANGIAVSGVSEGAISVHAPPRLIHRCGRRGSRAVARQCTGAGDGHGRLAGHSGQVREHVRMLEAARVSRSGG